MAEKHQHIKREMAESAYCKSSYSIEGAEQRAGAEAIDKSAYVWGFGEEMGGGEER